MIRKESQPKSVRSNDSNKDGNGLLSVGTESAKGSMLGGRKQVIDDLSSQMPSELEHGSLKPKIFQSESSRNNFLDGRSEVESHTEVHVIRIEDDDSDTSIQQISNFDIKLNDVIIKFDDTVPAEYH